MAGRAGDGERKLNLSKLRRVNPLPCQAIWGKNLLDNSQDEKDL